MLHAKALPPSPPLFPSLPPSPSVPRTPSGSDPTALCKCGGYMQPSHETATLSEVQYRQENSCTPLRTDEGDNWVSFTYTGCHNTLKWSKSYSKVYFASHGCVAKVYCRTRFHCSNYKTRVLFGVWNAIKTQFGFKPVFTTQSNCLWHHHSKMTLTCILCVTCSRLSKIYFTCTVRYPDGGVGGCHWVYTDKTSIYRPVSCSIMKFNTVANYQDVGHHKEARNGNMFGLCSCK